MLPARLQENIMTEQTTQRPSPEGSVLVHELNHRVDNEVAAAISVAVSRRNTFRQ
jgi:two-component sensor histidine kinase